MGKHLPVRNSSLTPPHLPVLEGPFTFAPSEGRGENRWFMYSLEQQTAERSRAGLVLILVFYVPSLIKLFPSLIKLFPKYLML